MAEYGHSVKSLWEAPWRANRLGQVSDEMGHAKEYIGRIEARPAFQEAINM